MDLIAISFTVLAVTLLLLAAYNRTQIRLLKNEIDGLNLRLKNLDNMLSAVMDGTFGMGEQLKGVTRDLQDTKRKQEQFERQDSGSVPYNQAVRMVANGANTDELISSCGLSKAEADLVVMLHHQSPPIVTLDVVDLKSSQLVEADENSPDEQIYKR